MASQVSPPPAADGCAPRCVPEAQIIQTHRDPIITIPSFADFIYVLRKIYSDSADPRRAGAEWQQLLRQGIDHALDVRASQPTRVLDVVFDDLVTRPLDVIDAIYAFAELTPDPTVTAAMHQHLQHSTTTPQPHVYEASTFGLTESGIAADFRRYRQFLARLDRLGLTGTDVR